jgi:CBS-domain-containing membrane protein
MTTLKQKKTAALAPAVPLVPFRQPATVFEVMTREVATVFPEMTLAGAVEALVTQDIGHLPVVDAAGVLVGMLSKSDVVRELHLSGENRAMDNVRAPMKARGKKGLAFTPGPGFHVDAEPATTVAEVMAPRVLSVRDDTPIGEACRMMVGNRIHGMPVTDARGKLVGFVSTLDVCGWVAQREGAAPATQQRP